MQPHEIEVIQGAIRTLNEARKLLPANVDENWHIERSIQQLNALLPGAVLPPHALWDIYQLDWLFQGAKE